MDLELPLGAPARLVVVADFAEIDLLPIEPGETPLLSLRGRDPRAPRIETHAGTTRVELASVAHGLRSLLAGTGGPPRAAFKLPPGVDVEVRTGAGRIRAWRLDAGRVELSTDAGAIELDDVAGALKLATDAGHIRATGVRGSIDASSSAGAVRLEIARLAPGEHHVRTDVGAIAVELARGLAVDVDARTSLGSSKVSFPTTPGAAAKLSLEAHLGAIKVRESARASGEPERPARLAAAEAGGGPYRVAASADELEAILARVADGSLSPKAAADLLRALDG